MSERDDVLASIAATIADYRSGEVPQPSSEHVGRWVNQFSSDVQLPILREMDYVLKQSYFSRHRVSEFLSTIVKHGELVGSDPAAFWKCANFLNIQSAGGSQRDILAMLNDQLIKEFGFGISECGEENTNFIYLDDAIFTGGRVHSDLTNWVTNSAPGVANLYVITIAIHEGYYFNRDRILEAVKRSTKAIGISWWRLIMLENRKFKRDDSDVLWPSEIPDDPATIRYVESMGREAVLRSANSVGPAKWFSCGEGRKLLEQEFLKAGVRIQNMCPNLPDIERPLGHSYLETLGFGTTLVTFRNCPNNAPLALWAGNPWYPLFPRKTNADSSRESLMARLRKLRGS